MNKENVSKMWKIIKEVDDYNEHTAKFWHYFTNKYIKNFNIRLINRFSSYTVLSNYIDDKIYNRSN